MSIYNNYKNLKIVVDNYISNTKDKYKAIIIQDYPIIPLTITIASIAAIYRGVTNPIGTVKGLLHISHAVFHLAEYIWKKIDIDHAKIILPVALATSYIYNAEYTEQELSGDQTN